MGRDRLALAVGIGCEIDARGRAGRGAQLRDDRLLRGDDAEQRQRVDAIFREAIGTTEGKLAIALGRAAEQMSTELYAYYEPLAYLVIVLDPFEKNVSVCVNRAYWDALAFQFRDVTGKAEQFLRDDQIIEALGLCIREGRAWVESMMKMGPP